MPRGGEAEGGFSLVECLIAMVLVSVLLMALAPVMFTAASRQVVETGTVERDAILLGEANRLSSLPVNALAAQAGCKTLPPQARYSHGLCIGVQPMGGGQTRIAVVVTPGTPLVAADSVVLVRTGSKGNPFNTGGGP